MTITTEPAPKMPSLVSEMVELLRALADGLFATYRPERHYMRGPGPRWHAKHAPALVVARHR